jgi:hypothetical protein
MKYLHVVLSIIALGATVMLLATKPWEDGAAPQGGQRDALVPDISSSGNPVEPAAVNETNTQASSAQPVPVPDTETVMGIQVRGDRNCTVTRHYLDLGDGTVSEAFSCDRPERPTSAYDAYASRTLEYLAYGDAEAASTLGKRLAETDPARARALILRALALQPQDIEPAMWLASQAYSLRGSTAAARRATANSYILTRIVQELGGDVAVTWIVEDLRESGFEDADLARLDARVARDLRRIGDIQLEVLGERTIREDLR